MRYMQFRKMNQAVVRKVSGLDWVSSPSQRQLLDIYPKNKMFDLFDRRSIMKIQEPAFKRAKRNFQASLDGESQLDESLGLDCMSQSSAYDR